MQRKQVKTTEYLGDGWYFDLTVPGAGHYVLDSVLHHNSGKTIGCLAKVHGLASSVPNAQIVIIRKTQVSAYPSVLRTFEEKILDGTLGANEVKPYGGVRPSWYYYPKTKSRIFVAGMDKASKVLSSEYDMIYVNQCEELSLADWETLTTRVTGRAGHVKYPQIIGDCNPSHPRHWIRTRAETGPLKLFDSTHRDNPMLYDQRTGELTVQGRKTMDSLLADGQSAGQAVPGPVGGAGGRDLLLL